MKTKKDISHLIGLKFNKLTIQSDLGNEKKCLSEWAEQLNISRGLLYARISKYKWTIEKAFNTPARKHKEYNFHKKSY